MPAAYEYASMEIYHKTLPFEIAFNGSSWKQTMKERSFGGRLINEALAKRSRLIWLFYIYREY